MSGQGGVIGSSPSPPVAAPRTLAPSCFVRPWTADHAGHAGSRVDLGCCGRGDVPPVVRGPDAAGLPVTVSETDPGWGASVCRRAGVRARGRKRAQEGERQTPSASAAPREGVAPEEVPDHVRSRQPAKVTQPQDGRAGTLAQGGGVQGELPREEVNETGFGNPRPLARGPAGEVRGGRRAREGPVRAREGATRARTGAGEGEGCGAGMIGPENGNPPVARGGRRGAGGDAGGLVGRAVFVPVASPASNPE